MSIDDDELPGCRKVDEEIEQIENQLAGAEKQFEQLEGKLREAEKGLHRDPFSPAD